MDSIENRLKIIQGKLSIGEFAKYLETPKTTVNQYLKGRPIPFDFAVLVCERFGKTLDWLATGKEVVAEPQETYVPDRLTEEERKLLGQYRKLNVLHKQMTLETVGGYEAKEALSEGSADTDITAAGGSEEQHYGRKSAA
ncbi:bacteriophage CI repressor [Oryzomonas japonica]|uniref:Bacteriophage CI repressor n=1 Tax=Oryzomonas japonica TaxID=2603858 RepID=A0A7J4ZRA9_9BACT|nr:helix-turn-helix domain-containing protein [Oryzomonas japonica]KAB0665626.1 bacteriophage CI repressor [Oryzomonas japonica]